MRAERLPAAAVAALPPRTIAGAILLAPLRVAETLLPKGTVLDIATAERVVRAAAEGGLRDVRLAWAEPGEVHEDAAAARLAEAVRGPGLTASRPRQSRIDLVAEWPGVLHVHADALLALNAIEPMEVFTLLHGQAVERGDVCAAVKVAPHLVDGARLDAAERLARGHGPLLRVQPYQAHVVGALVIGRQDERTLERFESGARRKLEALGSRLRDVARIEEEDAAEATAHCEAELRTRIADGGAALLLVGGVSAGDPTSPFFAALARLGGRVIRRGVPAHPGSMVWLAELDGCRILGLPQCGMFSLATAADLILPRLLTGEPLEAATLAELAHGGLLSKAMRFRFPAYARELDAPD